MWGFHHVGGRGGGGGDHVALVFSIMLFCLFQVGMLSVHLVFHNYGPEQDMYVTGLNKICTLRA